MLRKIFFLTERRGRQEGRAECVGVDRWASKNPRARLRGCKIRPLGCHGWRGGGEGLDFIRPFLAMASLKACQLWASSFGLTKRLGFHPTFSRHGIAQSLSALALLIWLNEKVGCQKGGSGRDASITRWQNAGRRLGPTRVWGVPCSPAPRATPCSGR